MSAAIIRKWQPSARAPRSCGVLTHAEREALEFLAVAGGPVPLADFATDCFSDHPFYRVEVYLRDIRDAELVDVHDGMIAITALGLDWVGA